MEMVGILPMEVKLIVVATVNSLMSPGGRFVFLHSRGGLLREVAT